MKPLVRLIPVCLFFACSLSQPAVEKHKFVLEAAAAVEKSSVQHPSVLYVSLFDVSPVFEGKSFVIKVDPLRYETDFYNEFFIAPSDMITECVADYVAKIGLFKSVVRSRATCNPDYELNGHIECLLFDFSDSQKQNVTLQITFRLLKLEDQSLLMQETLLEKVKVSDREPATCIKALNDALNAMMKRVIDKLSSSGKPVA